MNEICSLSEMKIGGKAVVVRMNIHGSMRRRMLDIGLADGTEVECIGRSPLGDPAAYLIRGAVIAIRAADSKGVIVKEV